MGHSFFCAGGRGKGKNLCGGWRCGGFFAKDGLAGMEREVVKSDEQLNKIKSKLNKIKEMLA